MMHCVGVNSRGLGYAAFIAFLLFRDNLATLIDITGPEGVARLTVFIILNTRCVNHNFADAVGAIADVRT